MRIYIVDDEELACRGLAYMVNCIFPQLPQEIHCFTSPIEALSKMELFPPDIILLDITMDEMNGIEFINNIDKQFTPKIVIVSGNDDYSFIRESFKLSVEDYLLKPVEFSELESVMLKLCAPDSKTGNIDFASEQPNEYGWVFVAVLKDVAGDELSDKIINIPQICNLKESVSALTYDEAYNYSVFIFSMNSSEHYEKCRDALISAFNSCCAKSKKICKASYSECVRSDEISKAISQAKELLKNRIYDDASICYGPEETYEFTEINDEDFEQDLSRMTPFLSGEDYEAYNRFITTWFSPDLLSQLHYDTIKKRYILFENKLLREISSENSSLQVKNFEEFNTIGEIFSYISHLLLRVFEFLRQNRYEVNIMSGAFDYINNNYNKDINLSFMSNKFNLSYSYFSRIFKMYAGVSFTQYLLKVRMEKAKELLVTSPNLKIKEVALMVGYDYDNVQNFTRAFKKYFGRSPQHYKK